MESRSVDLHIPDGWRQAVEALRADRRVRTIVVLGETASGKTTFARYLHGELSRESRAAYLDGDPGQSEVGPPCTVGLRLPAEDPRAGEEVHLRFVGSTSPQGHLLPTLTGVRRLLDRALDRKAERIVLDSCGLVEGPMARELQYHLIDLLQPEAIVALKRGRSLPSLLKSFRRRPGLLLLWLPVSPYAAEKPPDARRQHRRERFRRYFRGAVPGEIALAGLGLQGRVPDPRDPDAWRDRLFALCGIDHFVAALGIARELDPQAGRLRYLSPSCAPDRVACLQLGALRLTPDGEELPLR